MTVSGRASGYAERDAFAAILIGGGPTAGDAETAVALLGGRIVQRVDWDGVIDGIETALPRPVLVVEAWSVGGPLADGLLGLGEFAAAHDLPVVVSFDEAQIDIVTAHLFGRQVQPLCEPTIAERVGALAVAAELIQAPILHDPWRESEASRLQRLNQEVARIAEILARLTREEPGADLADRRRDYDAGPSGDPPTHPQEIRRMIRIRRLRDQFFADGLFEDPAWDMLLDLYAAELEGTRVSVSSLCIAAAVAPTTALRWITKLTESGLFVRHPDQRDRRRAFMGLSPQASDAMRGYVAAVHRIELAAV